MVAGLHVPVGTTVLELGPGTGPFTAQLAARLPRETAYLGIESHGPFVERLRQRFAGLRFAHDSAEQVEKRHRELALPPISAVICGLPFASLPLDVQDRIVNGLDRLLAPGAEFRAFQYLHARPLPAARRFRRQMDDLFGPARSPTTVLANLPPAMVLYWRRTGRIDPVEDGGTLEDRPLAENL